MADPATKLSKVKAAFESGNLQEALRIASKFPDLGEQANDIKRGHEAFAHPRFWQELGYDMDYLKEKGRAALCARWGFRG